MTPVELLIRRLGAAGDGIAETPQGPVYVARSLPGERIAARMVGRDRAEPEAVLEASPERVAPPCRHFGEGCGGCATQHWAEAPGIAWKQARLAEALTRAGFADPTLLPSRPPAGAAAPISRCGGTGPRSASASTGAAKAQCSTCWNARCWTPPWSRCCRRCGRRCAGCRR